MHYVAYMRQKPWRQMEKSLMVEEQDAMIEKYAEEKGWKIVKYYVDENGPDDDKKMEQMIRDGMGRNYEGVLVASFPYFATDAPTACQTAFEIFYASGIQFAVAEDDFDSTKLSSKEVEEYFEHKRRNMHSDNTTRWLSEREDLMLQKGIPYGYKPSEDRLAYVKDDEVADYVEGIFEHYLAGSKAIDIAHWLNENGVLNRAAYRQTTKGIEPKGNTLWNANKVIDVLKNDIYTGKAVRKYGGRAEEIPSEPYITKEEQGHIISRLEREKRTMPRNVSDKENPFMFKIVSAASGKSMFLHNGEEFLDSKYKASRSRKTREAHSIPFDTVMLKVLEQTAEEKRCAEKADEKILNGEGRSAFQEARAEFSVQMKTVLEKMQYFLEKDLHAAELNELDEEAANISAQFKSLERAFSPKNPWIILFLNTEIPTTLDRQTCRKLIERIVVSEDYSDVCVEFKKQEMKNYLPKEWWKEGTD